MEEGGNVIFECKTSACGKIIIAGEHAVVYDKKAISCPIKLFTKCHLKVIRGDNGVGLNLIEINKKFQIPASELEIKKDILNHKNFDSIYQLNNFLFETDFKELCMYFNCDFDFMLDKEKNHFLFIFKLSFFYFIFLNDNLNYQESQFILSEYLKLNSL
jgi:hypothetical protein